MGLINIFNNIRKPLETEETKTQMAEYELEYFDLRARGEVPRLLFAVAGVKYTDKRVKPADWPERKPHTPRGQMPILTVKENGKEFQLLESLAIGTFLANRFGLAGKNEYEIAEADQWSLIMLDLFNVVGPKYWFAERPEDQPPLLEKIKTEFCPKYFKDIDAQLAKYDTGFMVGDSLTKADLWVMQVFHFVNKVCDFNMADLYTQYPRVKGFMNKIEATPRIAEWIKNRPDTHITDIKTKPVTK